MSIIVTRILDRSGYMLKRIHMPPMRYAVILFAFCSWPFIWQNIKYFTLAYLFLPLAISSMFFMSRNRPQINAFLIAFPLYLTVVALSTLLSEHLDIRMAIFTRVVLYLLLSGAVLGMSSMKFEELSKAVKAIILVYLVLSLPSVLIFISFLAGIDLPYRNIDLGGRGDLYRLYPFGVISEDTIFTLTFGGSTLVRINGFSEEPGVLGTYVVFFIILNRLIGRDKSKKVVELLLHLLGILSFSLFYYVSTLILIIGRLSHDFLRLVRNGEVHMPNWSSVRIVFYILIVGVGILFYVVPGNPVYYMTVARLFVTEQGLLPGNSRYQYDQKVLPYLEQADFGRLLIGNGPGSNSLDEGAAYASWAAELYDTGILGMAAIGFMYLYLITRYSIFRGRLHIKNFLTLLPAILSFYQRPETISPIMIVFWIVVARVVDRSAKAKNQLQASEQLRFQPKESPA